MSDNVRQISDHPRYQAPLDPDDDNFERDRYLRMLDAGVLPPPAYHEPYDEMNVDDADLVLENLEEKPQSAVESPVEEPHVREPLSICVDCKFAEDSRPSWKRLFSAPKTMDLLCQAFPRKKVRNPVTGEVNYLPEGTQILANAEDREPLSPCFCINAIGTCGLFKLKITHR